MDIFEAIQSRQTVRKFKPDVPPLDDIKKIIDAARLAPSSTNSQMWHYLAIYNRELKIKMREAVSSTYDEIKQWPESKINESKIEYYKEYSTFFAEAPVVIAALMEPKSSVIQDILIEKGFPHKEVERSRPHPDLLSIGASIENLSLAAHALGYGTCWMTAPLCAYKKLENVLDVKEPYILVSLICLGIPENKTTPLKQKKKLDEILTIIK